MIPNIRIKLKGISCFPLQKCKIKQMRKFHIIHKSQFFYFVKYKYAEKKLATARRRGCDGFKS